MQEDIKCIEGGRRYGDTDGLRVLFPGFGELGIVCFLRIPFSDNLLKVPVGKRTVQPEDDAVVLDVYSFQTVAGMLVGRFSLDYSALLQQEAVGYGLSLFS